MLELVTPIPMSCPKGNGYAHFVHDRGMEHDLEWTIFLDNGEIWTYRNRDVRLQKNITYGREIPIRVRASEMSSVCC